MRSELSPAASASPTPCCSDAHSARLLWSLSPASPERLAFVMLPGGVLQEVAGVQDLPQQIPATARGRFVVVTAKYVRYPDHLVPAVSDRSNAREQ